MTNHISLHFANETIEVIFKVSFCDTGARSLLCTSIVISDLDGQLFLADMQARRRRALYSESLLMMNIIRRNTTGRGVIEKKLPLR